MAGQFVLKPTQRFNVVDIVQFGKENGGKPDFGSALACAGRHGVGPPVDAVEQLVGRVLQADEIVAAIARWPKHHPVAWFAKSFNGLHQETGRKGWAVAIDEQDAVMSVEQEITRSAQQHITEIVANLQLKPKRCRKQLPHDMLDSCGRIDAKPEPAEGLRAPLPPRAYSPHTAAHPPPPAT